MSVLEGLRILLVDRDVAGAERLAEALRGAGAVVGVTDPAATGLDAVRGIGAEVVVLNAKGLENQKDETVRRLRGDPLLRWASMLVIPWDEFWPNRAEAPDLKRLSHRIVPLTGPDRMLRGRAAREKRFDTRLELTGPSRLLRALASSGTTVRVSVRNPLVTVQADLSEGLVVGALAMRKPDDAVEAQGVAGVAALLALSSGRVQVEQLANPSTANVMLPVDEALSLAAAELPHRTSAVPAPPRMPAVPGARPRPPAPPPPPPPARPRSPGGAGVAPPAAPPVLGAFGERPERSTEELDLVLDDDALVERATSEHAPLPPPDMGRASVKHKQKTLLGLPIPPVHEPEPAFGPLDAAAPADFADTTDVDHRGTAPAQVPAAPRAPAEEPTGEGEETTVSSSPHLLRMPAPPAGAFGGAGLASSVASGDSQEPARLEGTDAPREAVADVAEAGRESVSAIVVPPGEHVEGASRTIDVPLDDLQALQQSLTAALAEPLPAPLPGPSTDEMPEMGRFDVADEEEPATARVDVPSEEPPPAPAASGEAGGATSPVQPWLADSEPPPPPAPLPALAALPEEEMDVETALARASGHLLEQRAAPVPMADFEPPPEKPSGAPSSAPPGRRPLRGVVPAALIGVVLAGALAAAYVLFFAPADDAGGTIGPPLPPRGALDAGAVALPPVEPPVPPATAAADAAVREDSAADAAPGDATGVAASGDAAVTAAPDASAAAVDAPIAEGPPPSAADAGAVSPPSPEPLPAPPAPPPTGAPGGLAPLDDPRSGTELVAEARRVLPADPTRAGSLCLTALARDARDNHAMEVLARAHLALRNAPEAMRWASEAVERRPRRWEYHLLLGDAALAAGDRTAARAAWQAVLGLDATNALATRRLRENP